MASKDYQDGQQGSEFSAWNVQKEQITTWGVTTTIPTNQNSSASQSSPRENQDAGKVEYQLSAPTAKSTPFANVTQAYNYAPPTISVQQQYESFPRKQSGVQDNGEGGGGGGGVSREEYLREWEKELKAREDKIGTSQKEINKVKRNFPRCFPLVHHDINNDIPPAKQRIVRLGFYTWMMTSIVLLYNWISVIMALGKSAGKIGAFFLALIYLVLGVPGAWLLWYGRLYRGAMWDGALNYCAFFFTFLFHFLFCVYAVIAPGLFAPKYTTTGIMSTIDAFDLATFVGIFYLVGTVLWGLLTLWSFFFAVRVYRSFRNQDVSGNATSSSYRTSVNGRQI